MDSKDFELLIAWINKCLHENAIIIPNDKLIDVHTKRKRQIDISVKFKNGPVEILAIIEARDRSRPVGVEYVEQVNSKKQSVNADIAIIVSSKGFYNSAILKASKYGIRTFSIKEALKNDWSKTINSIKYINLQSIESVNSILYFIDKERNQIIDPHPDFIKEIEEKGVKHLVFLDSDNNPYKSMDDLYKLALSNPDLFNTIKKGKENAISKKIYININIDKKVYLIDKEGKLRNINFICLKGDFWIEEKKIPPKVSQYRDPNNEMIAEIINFKIPDNEDIEILIENPDKINEDRKVHIKVNK